MDTIQDEQISRWWRYSTIIILLIGFSILSTITKLTYDNAPPIPKTVVDPSGQELFTREHILEGQSAFLRICNRHFWKLDWRVFKQPRVFERALVLVWDSRI